MNTEKVNIQSANLMIKMPNLLLIAGNGRNVGKTFLACRIIRKFSLSAEVVGIKISPHFHPFDEAQVWRKDENFVVFDEKQISTKDSSRMLQAGAKTVYFIMSKPTHLRQAFSSLENMLAGKLVVCESGGLHHFVDPGLFLFVKNEGGKIVKPDVLKYRPTMVVNNGKNFDLDIQNIGFKDYKFILKKS